MKSILRFWCRTVLALIVALAPVGLHAETVQYAYDEAGRLIGAHYDDGTVITYLYDPSGNLLRRAITTFVDDDGKTPSRMNGSGRGVSNACRKRRRNGNASAGMKRVTDISRGTPSRRPHKKCRNWAT